MKINKQCITRLARYRNALYRLKSLDFVRVFSDNIADAIGVTSSQVRKDFSIFGITGKKRGGYKIADLIQQIGSVLGRDEMHNAIVIGVGNIGNALISYPGFLKENIKIVAAFDIDPSKHDKDGDLPILPLDEISDYIKEERIKIAVIATPDIAAQQVVDIIVSAGVRGILNFAPIRLKSGSNVVISNVNLGLELETLIYFVKVFKEEKDHEKEDA